MQDIDKIVHDLMDYFLKKGKTNSTEKDNLFQEDNQQAKKYIHDLEEDNRLDIMLQEYADIKHYNNRRKAHTFQHILHQIRPHKRPIYRRPIFQYALAASVLLCIMLGLTWQYIVPSSILMTDDKTTIQAAKGLTPGGPSAIIQLDNGQTIPLESTSTGILVSDDLKYADGKRIGHSKEALVATNYMTLQVPRGGEYKVTLADGTTVYLNAESSIRYPSRFTGDQREVFLSGEAFFDVQHDREHPFIIHTDKEKIQVLGTSFNVKAYKNESARMVTLAQGSVQVTDDKQHVHILKPGQQSVNNGKQSFVRTVSIDDYIGWKDGFFILNNEDLTATMEQLGRWYNLEITVAPSAKNLKLWGSLGRYDSFDKVIEILKIIDKDITVKIHNRRVEIMKE